eukprot:2233359-Amphidinium_carterae.1
MSKHSSCSLTDFCADRNCTCAQLSDGWLTIPRLMTAWIGATPGVGGFASQCESNLMEISINSSPSVNELQCDRFGVFLE